jgi:hypothetical protein
MIETKSVVVPHCRWRLFALVSTRQSGIARASGGGMQPVALNQRGSLGSLSRSCGAARRDGARQAREGVKGQSMPMSE